MIKFLALSIGIATLPLSQKINEVPSYIPSTNYTGNFKNTITTNPFESAKQTPQTPEQLQQSNWYANAMQNIEQSEYHFKWEEKYNAYCTPNRKQNLRFFYNEDGFSVEPRTTKIPLENYEPTVAEEDKKYKYLPNWKVKFNLDKKQVGKGFWKTSENKAEYITNTITVQYINSKEGMRQNFIVQKPSAGHCVLSSKDELNINFSIKSKLKNRLNGNQIQFFHNQKNVLNYEDLKVWDATGKTLEAVLKKLDNEQYVIQVNTIDAVYPITIDPLSTGTNGTPDSTPNDANQANANFGSSVASAGDVNGDGYSDVIIGAPGYDEGANNDEGRAFVYHGSATGLSATPNSTPDDADQAIARFGLSVANAGDVNGDGYSDVIIGAYLYDDGANSNEGRAFVYHGSATGLSATPNSTPDDADQANAQFGISVANAGDVNGDGFSDVIIGANLYDDGANADEGRAFVYHGSATGLTVTPSNTIGDADQANANFGYSVASAGDVNGDGYSDVILGAYLYDDGANSNEGRAFVYHGSATGLSTTPSSTPDDANQANANFGRSVACAGDVNGDGYSDVIIGAFLYDDGANSNEGRAFVYHGSATGLSATPNSTPDDADQAGVNFSFSVASAGDVNGDGYSDVIIGAYLYDVGAFLDVGRAFVYHGSATGLSATPNSIPDDASQATDNFGVSVASAGDVNGDGYSDVIIGASGYNEGANLNEGRAFVYHGSAAGLSASPNNSLDDADLASARFGISAASAGDVNGDGYTDVIIGADTFNDGANTVEGRAFVYHGSATGLSATPNSILDDANQSNANFGISVASAGDVNGDGYSDVIVGCYRYNDGANVDEGRAFVYHGSATGLITTPASTPDDANQLTANFGISVASAGDVNGDGYTDVIIGANVYDDGANANEGRAFVYHGSATGLSATPNSIPDDANQASTQFGFSVASAGDVNGDGYSDIIIGAYTFDDGANVDEGRAFVYYGSATGVSASPNSILDDADQAGASFGVSVSSAGDINGDGYNDVIIGAYLYNDGPTINEGTTFVYHGSATGLSAIPNNTLNDANQVDAYYGISVANAGDVNGDGYSDIIVGALFYDDGANTNEGRAFVYHGSASGIVNTITTTLQSNQSLSEFGISVRCAGDINGDGYSDIIVGADTYQNGQSSEGAAFVYFGSSSGINITPTVLESNQASARMGRGIGSAGDINGDGYSDIIVGAHFYTNTQSFEGAAFVYFGSANSVSNSVNTLIADADQASAYMGISIANAGDINSDGFSDIIIGAYGYDDGANINEGRAFIYHGSPNGLSSTPNSTPDDADQALANFGESVATAGDVNGDGYSDVIIGADTYDDAGNFNEGRAYVYLGSVAGLSNSPNSIYADANEVNAFFGYSVASAGDVNGDGYSDIIIGAYRSDDSGNTDEGLVFVYHGSALGLSSSPNTILNDANQAFANFGWSVSTAGDVNGDGFSDVIIGAFLADDGAIEEGLAYIYYGSITGLAANPNDILDDGDQLGAGFGYFTACAGDVNGDGYSDVIVGAPYYNIGANTDEGRVFVYHGSSTGLSTLPTTVLNDANQTFAHYGWSVSTAGDLNGDGYSDVIIGARLFNDAGNNHEGRAYIYSGSSSGLSVIPTSTPDDANQIGANFGWSVSTAGDVNGDGYSDVIASSYLFDDGVNSDEGRVFLYNGNDSTTNKRNNLRLYNSDLTTPLNNTNFVAGNFGAGLYAKSFLGRTSGKLAWETRINYNAYSGNPITNSTFFTAQQPTFTDLGLNGVELKSLITKILGARYTKIRARVKYNLTKAITGQVYGPWRNVSSIIDANNLGVLPFNLISFNASWLQKGSTAKLDFVTDKENGICCFDIQKSSDGFNFTTIATVAAKNTNSKQTYSFVDANASSKKQYYRLKIKGNQGQLEYSNVQQLSFDKVTEILLFPNPTVDVLHLQLNKNYSSMNVQIVNVLGQVVKQYQSLSTQNQILQIPVKQLAAGNYWLQLQNGNDKQVLQFVKQ